VRALVTGASGFVGRYLVEALRRKDAEVLACGGPRDAEKGERVVDLADAQTIREALDAFRPTVIFHLAAQTFVPDSLRSPADTYETNVMGTVRLAEAVRESAGERPRIVFTSSAEVYGRRAAGEYPLRETLDLQPATPYGASKAGAEAVLLAHARSFDLDVVVARAFNHIGPRQSERFVVASLAAQLARVASGTAPHVMVGNLSAARDFLDVRDVVAAYIALAAGGKSGEIYNVCSGKAVAIRDVLRELIAIARIPVEVREDPQRLRSAEIPLSVGDPQKLRVCTAWQPEIPLVRSLRDLYAAALRSEGVEGRRE
jgi:GDP-4-dehydro-6-deoxy-D-mannose reductase